MAITNDNTVTALTTRYRGSPIIQHLRLQSTSQRVTYIPTSGETYSFRFPCPKTRGSLAAVPSLRPQSTFHTFLKDVSSGSLPMGSTSDTSNAENGSGANVPATRSEPTACLRLAQLKTEHRASPPNILLSHPPSPSTMSLDDPASPEFVGHAPDNEDRDPQNVIAIEATIVLQTGSCAI